jgi:hypothetical protein
MFVRELCSYMCTTADINLTTFMEIHHSQWKEVHNIMKENICITFVCSHLLSN